MESGQLQSHERRPPGALTVCVCVRDGVAHVDRCLKALLEQADALGVPVLVVDHASVDATPHRLEEWRQSHPQRLRVVRFEGHGLAAVRDHAWRATDTPWLAFVDVDCEVQGGWLQAVTDAIADASADSRWAAIGGGNRIPRTDLGLYRACSLLLATYVGGHDSILNRPVLERREVEHCPTLNVLYRRSALEDIGGFDADFTRVCEDLDLSRRLARRGYRLRAEPGMMVEHAVRATWSGWLRNMFLYGRGRCFHMKRHPGEFRVRFLAPPAVVMLYLIAVLMDLAWLRPPLALAALSLLHLSAVALLLAREQRRQRSGVATWMTASALGCLTHIAFGVGMLAELPRSSRKPFV